MSSLSPQIHPEYDSFIKALKNIAQYAVDLADTEKHKLSDGVTYNFSQDDFFNNLYVPRPQEKLIREMLNVISNFLIIVGGQGSGKTSLALRIMSDLDPQNSFGYFGTYVDVRTKVLGSYSHALTSEEAAKQIMEKIKNSYLNRLFPESDHLASDPQNKRLELIAFLLDPHNGILETSEFLTNLQFKASQLFKQYKYSMPKERMNHTMYDWIRKTIVGDESVFNLVMETHDQLTPSMVAHAAKELYGIRHQVIWIDNVDILHNEIQGPTQQAAKSLYAKINHLASVIISVRPQNIFRDYDLNEPGAPPVQTEVNLYSAEYERVSAHELGQIDEDAISSLISKRLNYSRKIHAREVNRVNSRLEELQTQLDEVAQDDERILNVFKKQLQSELETVGPIISDERFAHCQKLSSALIKLYQKYKIIYFCNGDIRQLLNLHVDCLAFLLSHPKTLRTQKKAYPKAINYTLNQISTFFLMRLRDYVFGDEEYPIRSYDLIQHMEKWFSNGQLTETGYLEHLIITATWNLSIEKQGSFYNTNTIPTIESLMQILSKLGYDQNNVFDALAGLYDMRNRVGLIEIQSPNTSLIVDFNQIKESDLIHVTPRGKCLVANISNTFGYTFACYRTFSSSEKDYWYPSNNTTIALRELMPSLCDLAWMDLKAIKSMRDNGVFGSKGWLDKYRSLFGIPILESTTRRSLLATGKKVGQGQRALHFEILIPGIMESAKNIEIKNNLEKLQKTYANVLADLESFTGNSIPSIREILDIPERDEN